MPAPPENPVDMSEAQPGASTSSANRQVATHSAIYVLGTALQGLGVLLVVPLITRTLPRAEYGLVASALVVIQLVGVIVAAGMPQVILREHHLGAEGPGRARTLAGAMLALAVGVGVAGAALVWGALFLIGNDPRLPALVVAASGALAAVVAAQALMRAQQRPGAFLVVAVISTVGAQLAGLAAARADSSAMAFLMAYTSVVVLSGAVGVVLAPPRLPWRDRAVVARGLRLAAPLLPHAIAMLVLLMGDVLIVTAMLRSEAVASYQVALQLGNMPFVLVTALANAWAPSVFARPAADRWAWVQVSGTALALLVAVAGAGVALLSPWLVSVAAPPSYDHQLIISLVCLMVLVAPAYLIYNGSSLALIDAARGGRLAMSAGAAAAVLVVGGLVATTAGLEGVALARVFGYLTLTMTCAWLVRHHGLVWRARPLAAVAGLSVLASGAGALLPTEGHGAVARLLISLVLGLGLLVGVWLRGRRLLVPSTTS